MTRTIDGVVCSTRVHGIVPYVAQLESDLMKSLIVSHPQSYAQADEFVREYLATHYPLLHHTWWVADNELQVEDIEDLDMLSLTSAIVIVVDADATLAVRVH